MLFITRLITLIATSSFLAPLIVRVLYLLGFAAITFSGTYGWVSAASSLIGNLSGLTGFAAWMMVNTGITAGANIIWSAIVAAAAFKGLNSVSPLKRWVWRGPVGIPGG